jgi:hypothetical protein
VDQQTYNTQVDARAQQMLAAICERTTDYSHWNVHALMMLDPDPEEVTRTVRRTLWRGTEAPATELMGGPFEILPAALAYCRWQDALTDEGRLLLHDYLTGAHFERGNTENHWLMYYTGLLLACEQFPDSDFTWNGLSPQALAAEAKRWILGTIERTARLGHHEYDSTHYHVEHMVAYVGLYEHSQDEHLRAQCEKKLSILVADMALEYFKGAWAGGHSREGYRRNTWTHSGAVQPLNYLYFGDIDFNPRIHGGSFDTPILVATYRPPALLAEIALDNSKAHIVKKTRAPRNIYRHAEHDPYPVRKYTYMSRSFALGSTQLGLPINTLAGPIDIGSWDLGWDAPNHQGKIVCNHPYRGAGRFSAFLSGFPQNIGRAIGLDKPYLQRPDRLFGASPYERMLQHEGSIVVLYRIPEDDEAPFVNLFLPNGYAWREKNGWILGDLGDCYAGIFPIGPYAWQDIREDEGGIYMVHGGSLIDGWLLRLNSLHTGLVLETIEADEVDSFDTFCQQRAARAPDLSQWPDRQRVTCETTTGHSLDITYDGEHRVDGELLDYDAYRLYESPNAKADLNTGKMTFEREGKKVELDFGIDPEKPLIPMRVIG